MAGIPTGGPAGAGGREKPRQLRVAATLAGARDDEQPSPGKEANIPGDVEGAECAAPEAAERQPLPAWALPPAASTDSGGRRWRLSLLDRTILSNTLICTGAAIAEPLMGMADTAFVGHLGLVPLAALGPNNTAFSFIAFFGAFSLSVATTDRIATCRAQGHPEDGIRSLSIALSIAIYCGAGLALLMLAFPQQEPPSSRHLFTESAGPPLCTLSPARHPAPQVLGVIGANEEIMPMAVGFMLVRAVSVPAMLVSVVAEGAYRAFLDLATPFAVIAGTAAMNIALNAAFVLGLGMGVVGSALATTLSTLTAAAVFLARLHWSDRSQFEPLPSSEQDVKRARGFLMDALLPWRAWRLPAWRRECAIICSRCGVLLLRATLIVAVYSVAGAVAARMGTAEVAGHQVLRQLVSLQVCLTWAYMSVGQSLVANLFESGPAGKAAAVRVRPATLPVGTRRPLQGNPGVARRVILYGSATAAALAGASWLARGALPAAFVSDPLALAVMQPAMVPACLMLLSSANNAFEGVLLGAGDTVFASRCFIPASLTAVGLLFLALRLDGGLVAVWWALALYYSVLLLLFAGRAMLPGAGGPLNLMAKQTPADGHRLHGALHRTGDKVI
eukprot:jgi/Tetstr1/443546/TSEL_031550.t1